MLRLDWNLLFNIINLIILYALMKRFLFKPVNAILEKRQQEADGKISKILLLGCALAEATAIYGFVIALLIILFLK